MDPTKSRYSPFNLRSKQCSVTIRSAEHRIQGGVKFGQLKGSSSRYNRLVPYLTFVYNTTVHKTTGATPFSLVYGAECQYPIDLFYPPQPGAESLDDGFVDDLGQVLVEELHSALGANKEKLKQLSENSQDAIFALESRIKATKENLRLLSTESDTNFAQIRSKMSRMLDWQRELVKWKNDCRKGGFAHSFRTVLEWANGTNYLTGLINEVSSYRMGLLTYEREMSDALEVLIHGRLPVSMVPPDDLAKILNQIEKKQTPRNNTT